MQNFWTANKHDSKKQMSCQSLVVDDDVIDGGGGGDDDDDDYDHGVQKINN